MSKREALARYNLIINKLRRHPSSFTDILAYLDECSRNEECNYSISKRTFQRDLEDIRSLFDIDIQFDFSRNVYHIYDEGQSEARERILEAFDTFNALKITERLSDFIHFEKRKPQGTQNLHGLLYAIQNRFVIKFTYHKFWEGDFTKRTVEPYALKEFRSRWYLIAKDLKDNHIKSFALDRLSELHITKRNFKYPDDFDVNQRFMHCFGIISPTNGQVIEEVVLSFTPFQGKYIKTMPLHSSQEILEDNQNELRIKLKIYITHDFIMELHSFSDQVKVLEPIRLANNIINTTKKVLQHYVTV